MLARAALIWIQRSDRMKIIKKRFKVRYIGESDPLYFLNGKVYQALGTEEDMYRVIDETGEDYLYDPECFEIVED